MIKLDVGQKLRCSNGEFVTINKVTNKKIIVEYKNKLHERPLSIIGKKLFIIGKKELNNKSKDGITTKYKKDKKELEHNFNNSSAKVAVEYTCNDCLINRKGDCFGQKRICKDFRPCPSFNKQVTKNWPSIGDATYYRLTSSKK